MDRVAAELDRAGGGLVRLAGFVEVFVDVFVEALIRCMEAMALSFAAAFSFAAASFSFAAALSFAS